MSGVSRWSVSDFKALSEAQLAISPLTVLTGPNSSGKSSVFQSLLMLGQSVAARGEVVLNGPLVRLGEPEDVIRSGQSSMRLSFGISPQPSLHHRGEFEVRIALGADRLTDQLRTTHLELVSVTDHSVLVGATMSRRSRDDAVVLTKRFGSEVTVLRLSEIPGAPLNRAYLVMGGLVPLAVAIHRSSAEIARRYEEALGSELGERASFEVLQELSRLVPKERYSQSNGLEANENLNSVAPARWTVRNLAALTDEERTDLIREAAKRRGRDEWVVVPVDIVRLGYRTAASSMRLGAEGILEAVAGAEYDALVSLLYSVSQSVENFGREIRYLGPLRDEPRVVHQAWDQSDPALPVGIKGELTAEVLTRRRNDQIVFNDWNGTRRTKSVPDAVAEWCEYLGIGDHIKILDLKKLGRGVQLRVNGIHRDLTTIGVGASQLLPVIVAGLTVPLGATLLIEQPELHLHPQVQSRLADFFLFARPGVKFMVETHSEYLITRLRLRVAQRRARPERIQVIFAEQVHGSTILRTLDINDLGDLSVWPVGFFDSAELDGTDLVRAVAARTLDER